MATSSLTKQYIVKDNESADRLIKIIESAPKKGTERGNNKHTSKLEEGRELFKRVFAKVSQWNSKKAIYLDEIWRLIGVTSTKDVAKFIYKIFKTIRKYGGSSVAITQDISDLFSLENGAYGKSILNNSSLKTFFSLEEENINLLSKYSNISEKEKIEIKSLRRGECLMFIGNEHILLNIEANNFEKNIIENKINNNKQIKL